MAKRNHLDWIIDILIILLLIIVIIAAILVVGNKFDIFERQIVPDIVDLPEYTAPSYTSCDYYHISNEFRNAYSDQVIDKFASNCGSISGEWTETNSEISCYWDHSKATIDCDNQASQTFKTFCEQSLKATWVCDNSVAFYGCLCKQTVPDPWEEPSTDNPEQQTVACKDVELPAFGDLGGICAEHSDTCDDFVCDHYWDYVHKEHKCGCTPTTFCGQYCYEYVVDTCECPPYSSWQTLSKSTFQCVPDGYYCEGGTPKELPGPFPN